MPDEEGNDLEALARREGWNTPAPEHIPEPTYWPFILAMGVTFLLIGVVTSYLFSIVGALLMIFSLAKWIGELVHADGR
ncbi:MAG: cytochrome c oxidase subunit 4 [Candidatus Binataceae bacterium]